MGGKYTYKNLERVGKKLKKGALMSKLSGDVFQDLINAKIEALKESEEKLAGIIASVTDYMSMIDEEYNIIWTNKAARELFGPNLIGRKCYSVYHGYDKPCERCIANKCFENEDIQSNEIEINIGDRSRKFFWCTCGVAERRNDGRPKSVIKIFRDITECKDLEKQLQLSYEQTIIYAEELLGQIKERKKAEAALKERKAALMTQSLDLKEVKTALKFLLKHREKDKRELEEKVLANVKELLLPYVQSLKNTRLDSKQTAYLSAIESNLNTIISEFAQKLSSKYLGLTSREIKVADLVREGKTSKEIAELLNISTSAVDFHRNNIRTKFDLKNKKVNLRSYLLNNISM